MKTRGLAAALVMMCVAFSVAAQLKITPEVGVTMLKKGTYRTGIAPKFGVGVRHAFNGSDDGWSIGTGLYFRQLRAEDFVGGQLEGPLKGKDTKLPSFVPVVPGESGNIHPDMQIESVRYSRITSREDFLQVPVWIQYGLKIAPDMRLRLGVGPYIAWGMTRKYSFRETVWDLNSKTLRTENYTKNKPSMFDFGGTAQVGLEVKRFAFLLNYETNLVDRKMRKDNVCSVGVGYSF